MLARDDRLRYVAPLVLVPYELDVWILKIKKIAHTIPRGPFIDPPAQTTAYHIPASPRE